jgi:hypothetical protein
MLRRRSHGLRGQSGWIGQQLPTLRDVLLFASVSVTVASSVAFAVLHLLKPSHARDFDDLPNIMSERCLDPKPTEHQSVPEHHAAVDYAPHR